MGSCSCGKFIRILVVVIALMTGFFMYVEQPKHWVYDPTKLHEISQDGIAKAKAQYGPDASATQIVDEVIKGMLEVYPETTTYTGDWLWNSAGGAMGSMAVLHCSFSEYIIIFGSTTGTEGHSGRHTADDFFTILYGEQWAALPGTAEKEVYKQGDQHLMKRGVAKQYRMPDTCFALEYARGNIVMMMPFGFFDALFSTLDFLTMWQTVMASAGNMIPNLIRGKI